MILTVNFGQPLAKHFWRDRRPLIMVCGCFDLLTVGHVRHLREAKRMGACLCVLVTADRHVGKPGRPIVSEDQRAEVVDALGCVDFTIVNPYPTAVEAIRCLRPEVYVKGNEYWLKHDCTYKRVGSLVREVEAVESVGGRVEFTDTDGVHTTDVLERVYRTEYERLHWAHLDHQHPLPT